ncbi:hypothetical protein EGR_11240 [Echinococcus granulosus]|uniref:Uncharacterized protein n=1 Tax=Echinococcus granulosus TaxID=6210 RepID=W6TYU9_ECHGR|nr:hypothetical protein EGR_11240 [Echinococcus granulosus]EUB53903.1 hypothetical protein EGR_11240 [Echinococcus granulosus]
MSGDFRRWDAASRLIECSCKRSALLLKSGPGTYSVLLIHQVHINLE